MSALIVAQNVKAVTSIVDRVHVRRNDAILLEETAEQARERDSWWDLSR
jgi:ABC-type transporter Mla maintaining outer membrane lipid asymmetry ATPase subunit MlaF